MRIATLPSIIAIVIYRPAIEIRHFNKDIPIALNNDDQIMAAQCSLNGTIPSLIMQKFCSVCYNEMLLRLRILPVRYYIKIDISSLDIFDRVLNEDRLLRSRSVCTLGTNLSMAIKRKI